jgi:Flp pilus assembly protein TadG
MRAIAQAAPAPLAGSIRRPARGASARVRDRRSRLRGQSIVEFALVVPLLLGLVGVTLDFARFYQVWMRLQAVTRDTAEFLATDQTLTTDADAQVEANKRICTAMVGAETCPSFVRPGAVTLAPVEPGSTTWTAVVPAEYDFQTWFLWPVVRGLTGADHWTIRTKVTYEVIRWPPS